MTRRRFLKYTLSACVLLASVAVAEEMQITVKTLTGRSLKVKVAGSDTILSLKQKLEKDFEIPADRQALVLDRDELKNERTVSECQIKDQSVLYLVLKQKP